MAQYIRGERGGNLLQYQGFVYKKKKSQGLKDYYQCNNHNALKHPHSGRCQVQRQPSTSTPSTWWYYSFDGYHRWNEKKNRWGPYEAPTQDVGGCGRVAWKHSWTWIRVSWFPRIQIDFVSPSFGITTPFASHYNDIDFATINHEWSRTHRGTQFLRKHDVNFGITIFTSLEQLELLANSRFNLADGTLRPRRHLTNRYTPYMGLRTIAGCHSFLPWCKIRQLWTTRDFYIFSTGTRDEQQIGSGTQTW